MVVGRRGHFGGSRLRGASEARRNLPGMSMARPLVAVEPAQWASWLVDAVEAGGATVVAPEKAGALVWTDPADPEGLAELLEDHPHLDWVQLPWAGIEPYLSVIREHPDRTWICGKGVYSEPVAEHALALALACRRSLGRFARAGRWTAQRGEYLLGTRVTIAGGGGIAESLLRLLGPFSCDVTVVRTTPQPMPGADRVRSAGELDDALSGADVVFLALPLTADTVGLMDRRRLGLVAPGAALVNVARGQHVVTDDLIPALDAGPLGGAGLDVTDPEPLPADHPLWDRPEVIITPHTANTAVMAVPLLSARVEENVRRFVHGEPFIGLVDLAKGY
jgi:phosphoglycerate dehydrogenase-like enzyme